MSDNLDLDAIEDRADDARAFQSTADGIRYVGASAADVPLLVAEVRKLRDQRDAVLAYTATIECPNCDHPVKFHDNRLGLCDANLNNSLGPCSCDWTSSVAEAIRDRYAALPAQGQTEQETRS